MSFSWNPIAMPLNPTSYQWTQISPTTFQRSALAGETMWAHRSNEYHQMYLDSFLTLNSPIQKDKLRTAVRAAWLQLRRETPDMGVVARVEGEKVWMVYEKVVGEETGVWCEHSLFFDTDSHDGGLVAMKEKVVEHKSSRDDGQHAILLVRMHQEESSEMVVKVELMLNVEHQITDGIGIRILLSKYLSILASNLSGSTTQDPAMPKSEHGASLQHPFEPWVCLLNHDQITSGPDYQAAVEYNHKVLLEEMPKNLGLQVLHTQEPRTQKHHNFTLSEAQSSRIFSAIKHTLSSEANITHLAHAAMVLALLRAQTLPTAYPSDENRTLYSPCWINGRRYLQDLNSSTSSSLTDTYLPICQTFAPIVFLNLRDLYVSEDTGDRATRERLVEACKIATKGYRDIKTRKSIMPESVKLMEYLSAKMATSKTENEITEQVKKPTADPFLLSDGITENYISHQYLDAFEVNEVQFAANAEGPNLIVRLSSWRGRLSISGEWRQCDYEGEMVVKFLGDVVALMGLIAVDC